jgi:hypothetical protein
MGKRWTDGEWRKVETLWNSHKPKTLAEFIAILKRNGIERTINGIWLRIREFVNSGLYPGDFKALQLEASRGAWHRRSAKKASNGHHVEEPEEAPADDIDVIMDGYKRGFISAEIAVRMIGARRRKT